MKITLLTIGYGMIIAAMLSLCHVKIIKPEYIWLVFGAVIVSKGWQTK